MITGVMAYAIWRQGGDKWSSGQWLSVHKDRDYYFWSDDILSAYLDHTLAASSKLAVEAGCIDPLHPERGGRILIRKVYIKIPAEGEAYAYNDPIESA